MILKEILSCVADLTNTFWVTGNPSLRKSKSDAPEPRVDKILSDVINILIVYFIQEKKIPRKIENGVQAIN